MGMDHLKWGPIALAMASAGLPAAASTVASSLSIDTPFFNLEHRASNSLGFRSGEFMRVGALSISPNGNEGTTVTGTTVNTDTGAPVVRNVLFAPSPLDPNFYSQSLAYNPALLGPWTLTAVNGALQAQAVVTLPAGTQQAPFVTNVTLSGTSANPTFSWQPPPGTTVNGYRINIYDKSLVNNDPSKGPINSGQVVSRDFLPSTTSHTVTAADFHVPGYAFTLGKQYSIEISLLQTRDGSSNTRNSNLKAISRIYGDFTPQATGGAVVNLPVVGDDGSFQFYMTVQAGQTYYIDPELAVGYDYATAAGDPNFASVTLPTGIGDGLYDLYGFDTLGNPLLLMHDLAGGTAYDFGAGGVSRFRVLGIEPSASLDPSSPMAFVTGLSFTGNGSFNGTQTPITVTVAVPEPATPALLALGLGLLGSSRRRQGGVRRLGT